MSATGTVEPAEFKKAKITVKKANVHTVVNFKKVSDDIDNKTCKLCRSHLMKPTHDDMERAEIRMQVSKGKCGHLFHSDCIKRHLQSGQLSCPSDMTAWTLDKVIDGKNKSSEKLDKNSVLPPNVTIIQTEDKKSVEPAKDSSTKAVPAKDPTPSKNVYAITKEQLDALKAHTVGIDTAAFLEALKKSENKNISEAASIMLNSVKPAGSS
jgi:hypothetical protein